tara:strand:+ start:865 stop:1071 length:207 start_codon:yes stop_codon:yes gene_type:complete
MPGATGKKHQCTLRLAGYFISSPGELAHSKTNAPDHRAIEDNSTFTKPEKNFPVCIEYPTPTPVLWFN